MRTLTLILLLFTSTAFAGFPYDKNSKNIADLIDEETANQILQDVINGYDIDVASRADWQHNVDEALKIAMQKRQTHK